MQTKLGFDWIQTIGFDEPDVVNNILRLHNNSRPIDLDPTFSIGAMYNGTGIDKPRLRFDIADLPDCEQADCRDLPLPDSSVNCIYFDPPFLINKSNGQPSGKIIERFSSFESWEELRRMYYKSLLEFGRVIKKNGIIIFKCQDFVHGRRQYWSHILVYNLALLTRFYPKDMFVLLARNRMKSTVYNQQHARKFHSYYWVLKNNNQTAPPTDLR